MQAVDLILDAEGGETDDPNDLGGHTRYGISQAAHPDVDVGTLTREGAIQIYLTEYWDAMSCEDIPWPLSLFVFDCAVNQGKVTATKFLQQIANIKADGIMGPETRKAAQWMGEDEATTLEYMAQRILKYQKTKNFKLYGHGWVARVLRMTAAGFK